MAVYLVSFTFTLFFAYLNERNLLKKYPNKFLHIITAFLIIFIPALIAGLRDYSVGVDVQVYAKTVFEYAKNSDNLFQIFQRFDGMEHGFLSLAYLVSKISSNMHIFLFFISIIIQLFTYLSLYRVRSFCSIFLGESIYLFIMYNQSLNIMRQSIAMAIVLFALTFVFERGFLRAIVLICISCFFHNTAILALIFIPVTIFINENPKSLKQNSEIISTKKHFFAKTMSLALGAVLILSFFIPIVTFLLEKGFIDSSYLQYIQSSDTIIKWKFLLVYILPYTIVFMRRKKSKFGYTLLSIGVIDIITYQLKYIMYYLIRISTYFMIVRMFSLAQFRIDFYRIIVKKKITKEEIIGITSFLLCFIYWISFIVINNDNGTIPYRFYF